MSPAPAKDDQPVAPIPLWRNLPPEPGPAAAGTLPGPDQLLPSGRQAISACLRRLGLGRASRVAIPEWSSNCLIGAVGTVAMPLPIRDAIESSAAIDVVLHYDQWGWPAPAHVVAQLARSFPDAALIIDKVDSPTLAPEPRLAGLDGDRPHCEVWSLSKILGLDGGGLARCAGDWLPALDDREDPALDATIPPLAADPRVDAFRKSDMRSVPTGTGDYVRQTDLRLALEREAVRRRANVDALLASSTRPDWPRWMRAALTDGAAPGIAPLFRGADREDLESWQSRLRTGFGLDTEIYHFNFSGNPLTPAYDLCLAVPIHGMVTPNLVTAAFGRQASAARPERAVVVGGGIAGLLAARLLAEQGTTVDLIERDETAGGLMRSRTGPDGVMFDYGVHFAATTGAADLDDILFEDIAPADWHVFDRSLREGHYYNGRLNQDTGCLDASTLPAATFNQGLADLLNSAPEPDAAANLDDYLRQFYGETFASHIFRPVLERLTGQSLTDLHPDAHRAFSLVRLAGLDSAAAIAIKRAPAFDAKIAYRRFIDGASSIRKLYPKVGGIGRWVDGLVAAAERHGANLHCGQQVTAISRAGSRITHLSLADGRSIECDRLIWTVPAALYLRGLGEPLAGGPPPFRSLGLFHFLFDSALQTDLHWVCCYDDDFLTYRVTLYPNITTEPIKPPPHHLTVELLVDGAPDLSSMADRVIAELVTIGLVPAGAKALYQSCELVPNAIPIATNAAVAAARDQRSQALAAADNVAFLGRAGGRHFMTDVLRDVYDTLEPSG